MIYKPSTKEQAHVFLDRCFEKKKWVKIEYIAQAKTMSQNRYIWLVFTIIGDDTGNTKEDIYEYYKGRFPVLKYIEVNGEEKEIYKTLSGFSKEEASHFIDKVVIDARQEGHVIPDPEDKAALEAFQYYRNQGML